MINVERRRAVRRCPAAGDPLSRARLRTGSEVLVTEISDIGAFVRTNARLLPGTHVDVHLMTMSGRVLRRARVVRAAVGSLDATGIEFRVALAFDAPLDSSARRVALTRIEDFANPLVGEQLPDRPVARSGPVAGSTPIGATAVLGLAPVLDKEAGRTSAKE